MFRQLPNLRDSVISVANPPQQTCKNQSPHENIDYIVKPPKISNIQKINRDIMRLCIPMPSVGTSFSDWVLEPGFASLRLPETFAEPCSRVEWLLESRFSNPVLIETRSETTSCLTY